MTLVSSTSTLSEGWQERSSSRISLKRNKPPSLTCYIPLVKAEDQPAEAPETVELGKEDEGWSPLHRNSIGRSDSSASSTSSRTNTVSYFARWDEERASGSFNRITGVLENGRVFIEGHEYDSLKDFVDDVRNGQLALSHAGHGEGEGPSSLACTPSHGQVPPTPKRMATYAEASANKFSLVFS
uniref:Uncharacterized protein n=1 Tax=Hanusia phi TaxID=3032 RepID=A0A7S0DU76_9CRYP|mmetsp:Transcript_10301/g.23538  ORF Transcript_10301/g.23538 Transcript_10301/m.23538 type:complete len:184 (+) Transcript_10301:247-798(+)|eukprot:766545-Hanusia_phi.AAC.9